MKGRRRPRTWLRLFLVVLVAVAAGLVFEAATWPDVRALAHRNPRTTAFIERWRRDQKAAGKDDRPLWTWVDSARISANLKRAVLVAEDINFFTHQGFDVGEIKNAAEKAVRDREAPRGASTITQQLAKNLWLSPSRNPIRKLKEGLLTRELERSLSKRRILELYLNVAELGPGVYGAEAAAQRFFGKDAAGLDAHEAAELAASLPRPRVWHPGVRSAAYERAVAAIERRMERAEFLKRLVE